MNAKQKAAARRLEKALEHCHKTGLQGGVFDMSFCLWPVGTEPHPADTGMRFFEVVKEVGTIIYSPMSLDGGSGI